MRAIALAPAVVLASLSSVVVGAQTADVSHALRDRVEAFQTAWNSHDAAGVAASFTDDADQIMGDGAATSGPALKRWWQETFATMEPARRITLTVSSLRLVSPDVALINTVAKSGGHDAQGKELATSTDRGTWVVVHKRGQWLMAALRVYAADRVSPR